MADSDPDFCNPIRHTIRAGTDHCKRGGMKRFPVVDIGRCSKCEGCMSVAPTVFRFNEPFGYVEVVEMKEYPEDLVEEAIKICPGQCISWDEGEDIKEYKE